MRNVLSIGNHWLLFLCGLNFVFWHSYSILTSIENRNPCRNQYRQFRNTFFSLFIILEFTYYLTKRIPSVCSRACLSLVPYDWVDVPAAWTTSPSVAVKLFFGAPVDEPEASMSLEDDLLHWSTRSMKQNPSTNARPTEAKGSDPAARPSWECGPAEGGFAGSGELGFGLETKLFFPCTTRIHSTLKNTES
jgi:hypothetical protein